MLPIANIDWKQQIHLTKGIQSSHILHKNISKYLFKRRTTINFTGLFFSARSARLKKVYKPDILFFFIWHIFQWVRGQNYCLHKKYKDPADEVLSKHVIVEESFKLYEFSKYYNSTLVCGRSKFTKTNFSWGAVSQQFLQTGSAFWERCKKQSQ